MTEDEMKEFLAENAQDIKNAVKNKLIEHILQGYRWEFSTAVAEEVNRFTKEEVVPEVRKFLEGEKGLMVKAAQEGCRQIGEVFTQRLVEVATKNMQGYNFGNIMEKVVKGY